MHHEKATNLRNFSDFSCPEPIGRFTFNNASTDNKDD